MTFLTTKPLTSYNGRVNTHRFLSFRDLLRVHQSSFETLWWSQLPKFHVLLPVSLQVFYMIFYCKSAGNYNRKTDLATNRKKKRFISFQLPYMKNRQTKTWFYCTYFGFAIYVSSPSLVQPKRFFLSEWARPAEKDISLNKVTSSYRRLYCSYRQKTSSEFSCH